MRKHPHLSPAALFALTVMALLHPAVWAQQPAETPKTGSSAAATGARSGQSSDGITLQLMDTPLMLRPSVKLEAQYNDNIYSTPNDRVSDRILVLTPALELSARQGANAYRLRLSSAFGEHQGYKSENYTNTTLSGQADLDLGTRLRTRVEAGYTDGMDPRGATNNALSQTPDHYRQTQARGVFSFGAQGAQGNLDLELGHWRREYVNNRATTVASDRTVNDLGATFHWRVGPKTTLLFQGKHSIIDYDQPSSTLGSTENALLVGGTWQATAKTSGTLRIGLAKKDFDDQARGSYTRPSWLGAIRWSPRTYSHVDLSLNRAPSETSGGVGDYIDRTATALRWGHAWSTTLTTEARATYITDTYRGATRSDNTRDLGLKATYRMRRWLSFGAGYERSARASDDSNFDYKRNVVLLFLEAAL